MKFPTLVVLFTTATIAFAAEPVSPAANALNSFGLDLIRTASQPTNNFLISPYSMQSALAMTYAGADGVNRKGS